MNMNRANTAPRRLDGIVPNSKARLREPLREVMPFYKGHPGGVSTFNKLHFLIL